MSEHASGCCSCFTSKNHNHQGHGHDHSPDPGKFNLLREFDKNFLMTIIIDRCERDSRITRSGRSHAIFSDRRTLSGICRRAIASEEQSAAKIQPGYKLQIEAIKGSIVRIEAL